MGGLMKTEGVDGGTSQDLCWLPIHVAPGTFHSIFCRVHPDVAIILVQTALSFSWKILGCRSRGALNPGAVGTGNISEFAVMQT